MIRGDVLDSFGAALGGFDDAALDRAWAWGAYDEEGVRFGILRTIEQVVDATVEVAARRAAAGMPPSRAQRFLGRYVIAWSELWAVCGRAEAAGLDVDQSPEADAWPLRTILDHLIEADLGFLVAIRNGLEQRRAGADDPARVESEDAWLGLAEVDSDAWKAAFAGSLDDIRGFHRDVRDRVVGRLGDVAESELAWTAPFWDGSMTIRFRLGRFESHLRQHTIQAEKAITAIAGPSTEAARLRRLLARAGAGLDAELVGAELDPELSALGQAVVGPLLDELQPRLEELVRIAREPASPAAAPSAT